jgi:anaerobic dimethyl sulfoxide reductase subunit C
MIGAHFHLSKPFHSFLALSNFRTSWLSREIISTLLFFLTASILLYLQWFGKGKRLTNSALGWLAIIFGFTTVYCMAKIYLIPTQPAWNTPETVLTFYSSVLLLGVMAMAAILIMDLRFNEVRQKTVLTKCASLVKAAVNRLTVAAGALLIPGLGVNIYHLHLLRTGPVLARTSYDLLVALYTPLLAARFLTLLTGVSTLVFTVLLMKRNGKSVQELSSSTFLACLLVIVGEVLGRFLFYAAHIRIGL